MAELLFWPALVAYGEAAVAYAGHARRPGGLGRAATWGVRVGWLAQTALLVVQAVRAETFAWGTWAGSLNLLVWLVVSVYLAWGCRPRYRLLGLAVMPPAAALLALSYAAGGIGSEQATDSSTLFLVLHVGLVLAAFAGFALAAGLTGVYLWQERRLKRRERGIFRLAAPALVSLDDLAARTTALALAALTLGIAVGLGRLLDDGEGLDAVGVASLATWGVYAIVVAARYAFHWRGRRIARLTLVGFCLVLALQLALPVAHVA